MAVGSFGFGDAAVCPARDGSLKSRDGATAELVLAVPCGIYRVHCSHCSNYQLPEGRKQLGLGTPCIFQLTDNLFAASSALRSNIVPV